MFGVKAYLHIAVCNFRNWNLLSSTWIIGSINYIIYIKTVSHIHEKNIVKSLYGQFKYFYLQIFNLSIKIFTEALSNVRYSVRVLFVVWYIRVIIEIIKELGLLHFEMFLRTDLLKDRSRTSGPILYFPYVNLLKGFHVTFSSQYNVILLLFLPLVLKRESHNCVFHSDVYYTLFRWLVCFL